MAPNAALTDPVITRYTHDHMVMNDLPVPEIRRRAGVTRRSATTGLSEGKKTLARTPQDVKPLEASSPFPRPTRMPRLPHDRRV